MGCCSSSSSSSSVGRKTERQERKGSERNSSAQVVVRTVCSPPTGDLFPHRFLGGCDRSFLGRVTTARNSRTATPAASSHAIKQTPFRESSGETPGDILAPPIYFSVCSASFLYFSLSSVRSSVPESGGLSNSRRCFESKPAWAPSLAVEDPCCGTSCR